MAEKKGFLKEFKEFISKGNIVDMAVGVIVGGAFTTIVNTLVKSVLTPLINFVIFLFCGSDTEAFTGLDIILIPQVIDPETNVVIKEATVLEISSLITAIINFLLIALTLFIVVKFINKIRNESEQLKEKLLSKEEKETINE